MTLKDMTARSLPVSCKACGHGGYLHVDALCADLGPEIALNDVLRRARCRQCGQRGMARLSLRIAGTSDSTTDAGLSAPAVSDPVQHAGSLDGKASAVSLWTV